jgi:hypothetical protein
LRKLGDYLRRGIDIGVSEVQSRNCQQANKRRDER